MNSRLKGLIDSVQPERSVLSGLAGTQSVQVRLYIVSGVSVFFGVLIATLIAIAQGSLFPSIYSSIFFIVSQLAVLYFAYKNKIRLALALEIYGSFIVLTILIAISGGGQSPLVPAMLTLLLVAGYLGGWGSSLGIFALMLFLTFMERSGIARQFGVPNLLMLDGPAGELAASAVLIVTALTALTIMWDLQKTAIVYLETQAAQREASSQLATIFEVVPNAIISADSEMNITAFNRSAERLLGLSAGNGHDHHLSHLIAQDGSEGNQAFWELIESQQQIEHQKTLVSCKRVDESEFKAEVNFSKYPIGDDQTIVTLIIRDLTSQIAQEEKLRSRLRMLESLQQIDMVINSSLDVRLTLDSILKEAIDVLSVDALSILLLNKSDQKIYLSDSLGFRHPELMDGLNLGLEESLAGSVVLEKKKLEITHDLEQQFTGGAEYIQKEGFKEYLGMPLVSKGDLIGVLEIWGRQPLRKDEEWHRFLQNVADQTAIAIDNSKLVEDLQRSNIELNLAYEATLEGWVRALDLRDNATEGHTQRVTSATVGLARAFGMNDDEISHIRRGALLHDIGKVGIPDSILLKPGKLTDEEWQIMRKHPEFAFEMLYPIEYLRPALDIPYSHHERWDGSGYPMGLKGTKIPIAARLFAVIDVWDALTSDRPYRKAWDHAKVLSHIKRSAGSHFDPDVVDHFIRWIGE